MTVRTTVISSSTSKLNVDVTIDVQGYTQTATTSNGVNAAVFTASSGGRFLDTSTSGVVPRTVACVHRE